MSGIRFPPSFLTRIHFKMTYILVIYLGFSIALTRILVNREEKILTTFFVKIRIEGRVGRWKRKKKSGEERRISIVLTFRINIYDILKNRKQPDRSTMVRRSLFYLFSHGGIVMTRYYKIPTDPTCRREDDPNCYTYVDGYGFTPPPPLVTERRILQRYSNGLGFATLLYFILTAFVPFFILSVIAIFQPAIRIYGNQVLAS